MPSDMKRSFNIFLAAVVLLLFQSDSVHAHAGHSSGGIVGGILHPLLGFDHLLAMVAVGLWSSRGGSKRRWLLPVLFVSAMIPSMWMGIAGLPLPGVEMGIAASVIGFGALIATRTDASTLVAGIVAVVFAMFHGQAHGAEMPEGSLMWTYGLGMVMATAALHCCGVFVGLALQRDRGVVAYRLGGAVIAGIGVGFLAGIF